MASDVKDAMETLANCCLHNPDYGPEDIAEVVWELSSGEELSSGDSYEGFHKGTEFGPESSQHALVKLTDGTYGYFSASEDYTGHGCQCGAYATRIGDDPELVWMQIPEWERDRVRQAVKYFYAADTAT